MVTPAGPTVEGFVKPEVVAPGGQGHGPGRHDLLVGVAAPVPLGGGEVGVNRLVGKVKEERFIAGLLSLKPVYGVIGQLVGDVALLWNAFPVYVQAGLGGKVVSLASKADPMIEAGTGFVVVVAIIIAALIDFNITDNATIAGCISKSPTTAISPR